MFYFIYQQFFDPEGWTVFLRLFRYITFRSMAAAGTAFVIAVVVAPRLIVLLRARGLVEPRRGYDRTGVAMKRGVPTMGGLLLLAAIPLAALLWCDLRAGVIYPALVALITFGVVGAIDDIRKARHGRSERGLSRGTKYLVQVAFGLALAVLILSPLSPITNPVIRGSLYVPFVKSGFYLGWWIVPLSTIFMVYAANAVNLADGMDGLASVPVVLVAIVLGIFAYLLGNIKTVEYLQFFPVDGQYRSITSGELAVVSAATAGAVLGFLWFNAYPASLFMGDTGSLALGGMMGTVALLLRQEGVFLIAGGLFVLETLSSFVQHYIGIRLLGRRILLRAPLHDALLFRGIGETKVTVRLWIVAAGFALLALATLKVR